MAQENVRLVEILNTDINNTHIDTCFDLPRWSFSLEVGPNIMA